MLLSPLSPPRGKSKKPVPLVGSRTCKSSGFRRRPVLPAVHPALVSRMTKRTILFRHQAASTRTRIMSRPRMLFRTVVVNIGKPPPRQRLISVQRRPVPSGETLRLSCFVIIHIRFPKRNRKFRQAAFSGWYYENQAGRLELFRQNDGCFAFSVHQTAPRFCRQRPRPDGRGGKQSRSACRRGQTERLYRTITECG